MNRPHSSHYPSAMMRRTARKLYMKMLQIHFRINDIRRKLEKAKAPGDRQTALWLESIGKLVDKAEKCCLELEPLRQELLDNARKARNMMKLTINDKEEK